MALTLEHMHPGIAYSPPTHLTAPINATATSIEVADGNVFPPGPNIAVIGVDRNAETIIYSTITGNIMTGVTRAVEGTARVWGAQEPIGRNWSNEDYRRIIANILLLNNGKEDTITPKRTAFNRDFGNSAGTVTQGNDERLSDAREPLAHNHTGNQITSPIDVANVPQLPLSKVTGAVTTRHFEAMLLSTGWSNNAPYTQTINISGMLATMKPTIDIDLSRVTGDMVEAIQAWGRVGRVQTNNGNIVATCFEEKPEVNIPIQLKDVS